MNLDMQMILKQKLLISCYFSKNKVHGHAIEKKICSDNYITNFENYGIGRSTVLVVGSHSSLNNSVRGKTFC